MLYDEHLKVLLASLIILTLDGPVGHPSISVTVDGFLSGTEDRSGWAINICSTKRFHHLKIGRRY